MSPNTPLFYSRTLSGHRREYLEFSIGLFGGERAEAYGMFNSSRPLLFLMVEDSFVLYFIVSVWRSLFGWRTVGLLFRPKPAVEAKSWRLRIKKTMLKFLRKIEAVSTLSIVPTLLDSRFDEIVDGWIYDFQLWDLSTADRKLFNKLVAAKTSEMNGGQDAAKLVNTVKSEANGKLVISTIGRQDLDKGFDQFAIFFQQNGVAENWHPVVGGKVNETCSSLASSLEAKGGTVLNRFVSDAEIIGLYAVTNIVWCAYAENYDQASGILGRAVQLGLPVIVRKGSISHRFCLAENIPHAALSDFDDLIGQLPCLEQKTSQQGNVMAQRFRASSLQKLRISLGIAGDLGTT